MKKNDMKVLLSNKLFGNGKFNLYWQLSNFSRWEVMEVIMAQDLQK